MAKHATLNAEKRDVSGTTASKRLRREGIVPAVVYGSEQREYTVQVDAKEFGDLARKQSSNNFLVDLEIAGAKEKSKLAFVQEIQVHPITGNVLHIDFQAVGENETIHATIPITLKGEAAGVKAGGIIEQLLHTIDIHCKPNDLPEGIEYDVTDVDLTDAVYIRDLNLGDGVGANMPEDVIVAICNESRALASDGGDEEEGGAPAVEGDGAAEDGASE